MESRDPPQSEPPMDFWAFMYAQARLVAEGQLGLHDEPYLWASEPELLARVRPDLAERVKDMVDSGLALPIQRPDGESKFHVLNCMEFVAFVDKMTDKGIPLEVQQVVAGRWYSLFPALVGDVDHELVESEREAGRPLTRLETALIRVINDYVVCNQMGRWQDAILENAKESWEPDEARGLLDRLKDEAAERARPGRRSALESVGEQVLADMIAQIWKPPRRWYQNRGIKAFVDPNDASWTRVERDLVWKGEFDFALCDRRGEIQAVVEYDGAGHYGNTTEEKRVVQRRDRTKERICRKARIPLLRVTDYYLYSDELEFVRQMLRLLSASGTLGPKAAEALREELRSLRAELSELEHRLDICEKQGAASAIVGLVWELPSRLQRVRVLRSLFRKLG